MKKRNITLKCFIICLIFILTAQVKGQTTVNGEIIADTNNLVVIKVWGTHAERGYAHGYLLGDKITDIMQNFLIPSFGSYYSTARDLISNGQDLIIDSLYQVEAKSMVDGMDDAGANTANLDYIDLLIGSCWSDLEGFISKKSGVGCSCLLNWGEGTSNSFLYGKSIVSRFYDWSGTNPAVIDNAAMIIHIPSESNLQPWLIVGYAGEMVPSGGGVSQGGLSMYKNAMSDYTCSAVPGVQYAPYQFTMRKILETDDFNGDGIHNTQDARDGFNANPQGYPVDKIIPVIARSEGNSDSLTAMVAEIAPLSPTHVYRTNSYDDLIPGANLYAANSQIKRNNAHNYCPRYYNVSNNFGDSTNFGIQKNYDVMVNYSTHPTGLNYGFIQHVPELDLLKVSVYRDNTNAYALPMTSFDLREFFNREPYFTSQPVDSVNLGEYYTYLITAVDPDPYDVITFDALEMPSWLNLIDNGDGTALLSGIPDEAGVDSVIIVASDGMIEISQEFEMVVDQTTQIQNHPELVYTVHPNPFNDVIHIAANENLGVEVHSLTGKLFYQGKLSFNINTVDLGFLPSGIYIMKLYSKNRKSFQKIIKN